MVYHLTTLRPCPMVCLMAFSTGKKASMGCWKQLKDDMEEGSD